MIIFYSLNTFVFFSKNNTENKQICQIMNEHNFDSAESFYFTSLSYSLLFSEADLLRWSYEKQFWKHASNLQENTHAVVLFQ